MQRFLSFFGRLAGYSGPGAQTPWGVLTSAGLSGAIAGAASALFFLLLVGCTDVHHATPRVLTPGQPEVVTDFRTADGAPQIAEVPDEESREATGETTGDAPVPRDEETPSAEPVPDETGFCGDGTCEEQEASACCAEMMRGCNGGFALLAELASSTWCHGQPNFSATSGATARSSSQKATPMCEVDSNSRRPAAFILPLDQRLLVITRTAFSLICFNSSSLLPCSISVFLIRSIGSW